MKTLAGWPARHPVATFLLLLLLSIAGLVYSPWLATQRLVPERDAGVRIDVELPGIDSMQIESAVTRPLERSLAELPGLQRMLSRSSEGYAEVRLQFASSAAREAAFEDVRVLTRATSLPSGTPTPTVERDESVLAPSAVYAISAPSLSGEVAQWAEQSLRRPLQEMPETSVVRLEGAEQTEILVQPNMRRMATLGLSFDDLIQALRGRDEAPKRRGVRATTVVGSASLEAIAARAVRLPGGETVSLAEVAEISLSRKAASSQPRYRGEPALLLYVYPRSALEASLAAERTSAHLAWLRANGTVPAGVQAHNLFDEADETRQWRRQWLRAIGACVLAAFAAISFFLGIRRGLVTFALFLVSLPLAATVLWLIGFAFNVMTATGLMFACIPLVLVSVYPLSWRGSMAFAVVIMGMLALVSNGAPFLRQASVAFFAAIMIGGIVRWLLTPWFISSGKSIAVFARLFPRGRAAANISAVLLTVVAVSILAMRQTPPSLPAIAGVVDTVVTVHVWGQVPEKVAQLARELAVRLHATPGVAQASESTIAREQWRLQLDAQALQKADITLAEIGRAFAVARGGLVIGDGLDGEKRMPLRLRLAPDATGSALDRLLLRGEYKQQRAIYLRDVGLTLRVNAPAVELRIQQMPAVEINVRLSGPEFAKEVARVSGASAIPTGYFLDTSVGVVERLR